MKKLLCAILAYVKVTGDLGPLAQGGAQKVFAQGFVGAGSNRKRPGTASAAPAGMEETIVYLLYLWKAVPHYGRP